MTKKICIQLFFLAFFSILFPSKSLGAQEAAYRYNEQGIEKLRNKQYKEAIEVEDEETGKKLGFQDLLKRFQSIDKDAWVRYLIYRDLRSRGYVAREGFGLGIDFRVYERGDYGKETAKHLIFGIQEGQPVIVEELARTQRYVQNLKKNLILAVINRRGEIVYYSLSQLNLK